MSQRTLLTTLWVLGLKGLGLCLSYVLLIYIAQVYGPEGSGLYNLTTNAVNLAALAAMMGVEGWMLKSGEAFVAHVGFWKHLASVLAIPMAVAMISVAAFALTRAGTVQNTLFIGCVFVPVVMAHTLAVEGLASVKKRVYSELMRSIWRPVLILAALVLLPLSTPVTPLLWAGVWTLVLAWLILWHLLKARHASTEQTYPSMELQQASRGFWWMSLGGFALANMAGFVVEWQADMAQAGVVTVLIRVAQLSTLSLLAVQVVWGPEISQAPAAEAPGVRRKAIGMGIVLALIAGGVLWLCRGWIFSFFGTAWKGVDGFYAPILVGQVLYSASAGWMLWVTMRGGSRIIGRGFLLVVGLQCLAWLWPGAMPYLGWIHGGSFALLACWNVRIGQRSTFAA